MAGSKAIHLKTDSQINVYIDKIEKKATARHASNVSAVISPLARAVHERLDLQHDEVYVATRNGEMVNVCWISIAGNEYYFRFNRKAETIEVRANSRYGTLIQDFENSTPDLANVIQTTVDNL